MAASSETIDIPHSVPLTRVADLLCSGFEGGVGYWCRIVDYREPPEKRSVWGESHVYPHVDYPLTGGAVVCEVTEEDDPKPLVLDRAAIERGLKLMSTLTPRRHWTAFLHEDEDAETGDVFIQLCLLGEIVYG